MQIDDKTYFEEEQRMDSRWIWFFAVFLGLILLGVGITLLMDKETDLNKVIIVMGSIVISDAFLFYIFKTMKLEIVLTKKGFHYLFVAMIKNKAMLSWNDVQAVSIKKSPYRKYGKKWKYKYGEVYSMNTKTGVEIHLKNGKKKFFSLKDPDAFSAGYNKLNLTLPLNKELN